MRTQPDELGRRGGRLRVEVPAAPDIGFFGRDEALLALDRAFDSRRSCCCTPWPGRARPPRRRSSPAGTPPPAGWTGRAVLWTSFEHHTPLERVLDAVGAVFAPLLEANGIHWAAITDPAERRD